MIYNSASNGKVSISVKSEKSLRKKCPYSELFWSAFSRIRTEYGPNAGKCGENEHQNNFE